MQKTKMKKRCRDGVTCVVLCTLPSIYLVCVVFGTAIPTSFYILENVFHTCILVGQINGLTASDANSEMNWSGAKKWWMRPNHLKLLHKDYWNTSDEIWEQCPSDKNAE